VRATSIRTRRLSLLAVAAVSLGAVACSAEDATERAVNQAIRMEGGDGRISIDGESITMTDGESTVSMGSGDLPAGYPANFPVFDPSVEPIIAMAFQDDDQGELRMTASYAFAANADEVAAWYEGALVAAGYDVTDPYSGGTSSIGFEGQGWTGGLGIFDQGTQTSVNVHLERPVG
jgi:hypothetical protein